MEVEDVAGERLTARRTTQQQRHGAVGVGLLGQVVEDDQHVLALVHPVLADGRTGVRGDVLVARGVGGRSGDDGRVLQRARLLEAATDLGDRGALLADGDVDAANLAVRVAGEPVLLLVEDGVDRDRGLAGAAVADDQLTLAAADRRHGVDRLEAGLQRLLHRLTLDHRGGLQLEGAAALGGDRALAVERVAQGVDHAAEEVVADRHRQDLAGAADLLALLDAAEVAQDDRADLADVEVQRQTTGAVLELQQLVRHRRGKAGDMGDAVPGVDDGPDLLARGTFRLVRLDEALKGVPDLVRPDRKLRHLFLVSLFASK